MENESIHIPLCWHCLSLNNVPLPRHFTNPFRYEPHPWVVRAASIVQGYLNRQSQWHDELSLGKMFGVLIVEWKDEIGFLAAYSGILGNRNDHSFFVPAVYDMLQPDGTFRMEEQHITAINRHVMELENAPIYRLAQKRLEDQRQAAAKALRELKESMKECKRLRDAKRQQGVTPAENELMVRESQHQKAHYRRVERQWAAMVAETQGELQCLEARIETLKQERRHRSAALQQYLFRQFRMLNAKGEEKDLCDIFREYNNTAPPAGSGECAAPKLLQFAYRHGMRPLLMGEFWWGASPVNEVRRHGSFYPSCRSKCAPILHHMLQGLSVETSSDIPSGQGAIEVLYEDDALLAIRKPSGMLSVRGKDAVTSVEEWVEAYLGEKACHHIVHRLDMDTSGLLLLCKTKEAHRHLQRQFEEQTIQKTYIARVVGHPRHPSGFIRLPLIPDLDDRPRQKVDAEHGKMAVTRYRVLQSGNGEARVELFPLTGRTHQLRVHCAHQEGMDCPIVGDCLYGTPGKRLFLHASCLTFVHPVSGKKTTISCAPDF